MTTPLEVIISVLYFYCKFKDFPSLFVEWTDDLDFHTRRVISSDTVTAMLSSTGFNAIALIVSVCSANSNSCMP